MTEKKKMGRPPAGTEPVMVRMTHEMVQAIDEYRRTADDLPTRPEVIRRAVETYLKRESES
jgi:metal-responsive CopG/Arc/MetJ family transcriptional regulator